MPGSRHSGMISVSVRRAESEGGQGAGGIAALVVAGGDDGVVNAGRILDLARISVRHEALLVRMEVRDRPSPRRRSGGVKLREA
jgi:hypothetical protein